jgi:hypothetical protein
LNTKRILAYILVGTALLAQQPDNKSLRRRVADERRDILMHHSPGLPIVSVKPTDLLKTLVCQSDTILVGSVLGQREELTVDEEHIQTVAELKILRVIKSSTEKKNKGESLLVVRPGGTVKIGDFTVMEGYASYPAIVEGEIYLFFLVRSGADYKSMDPFSTFHLRKGQLKRTTEETGGPALEGPIDLSLKKIEQASAACAQGE